MPRCILLGTILLLLGCSTPAAGQTAYPRLRHVVGAIRTAGLLARAQAVSPPSRQSGGSLAADTASLTSGAAGAVTPRRISIYFPVGRRVGLRASGLWLPTGPAGAVGLALQF